MAEIIEHFNNTFSNYLISSLHTTEDFYLVSCGNQRHSAGQSIDSVVKSGYHLHFILSGKGYLKLNDKVYNLEQNQIFLLPENTELSYSADKKDPWHYVWLSFGGTKALDFLTSVGITPQSPVRDCELPVEAFADIINQIVSLQEMTYSNEMARFSLMFQLFALLIKSQSVAEKTRARNDYASDVYVENAVRYIYHNFSKIKVTDISQKLGISQSHLSHMFKEKKGTSLQCFLITYRLNQAAQLLINTQYSAGEIAVRVGYDNQFSFSKSFKKKYGVSPSQYRSANSVEQGEKNGI